MLQTVLVVVSALIAIVIIVVVHDMTCFKVVHYTLTEDKLKKDMRFVVIADLHDHQFPDGHKKLFKAIEREQPDAVLVAGDLLVNSREERFHAAIRLLEGLAGKYPIFYAAGNHETKQDTRRYHFGDVFDLYQSELDRIQVHMMRNESVYLEDANISIYGLELPMECFSHFHIADCPVEILEQSLGKPRKEHFNLLIGHNPEHFQTYVEWGSDLVISGHQHGGIVRLPFLGGVIATSGRLFPKYDGGYFEENHAKMIISRGLGTHTIPIRFLNPCELVVLDLKRGCK